MWKNKSKLEQEKKKKIREKRRKDTDTMPHAWRPWEPCEPCRKSERIYCWCGLALINARKSNTPSLIYALIPFCKTRIFIQSCTTEGKARSRCKGFQDTLVKSQEPEATLTGCPIISPAKTFRGMTHRRSIAYQVYSIIWKETQKS